MKTKLFQLLWAGLLLLMITQCEFTGGGIETPNGREVAEEKTNIGMDKMGQVVNQVELDGFTYDDYGNENWPELMEAHREFQEALALDPENTEARFGQALTSLLLALQAENIGSLLDSAEVSSPFDANLAAQTNSTIPALVKRAAEGSQFPEFHEFQDALADSVLPVLDQIILDMTEIHSDTGFFLTFEIDELEREFDQAEMGIFLAGLKILRALVTLPLSYDMDIDNEGSYLFLDILEGIDTVEDVSSLTQEQKDAFQHITDLLSPGSPFLTAKDSYRDRLATVSEDIQGAVDHVKASLQTLDTEQDDQSDDILALCERTTSPDCITRADRDEAVEVLDEVNTYLDGPVEFSLADIDTAIAVDVSVLLGKISDFKKLLPYYAFYPVEEWSDEKPIVYFTDQLGNFTGTVSDLITLGDSLDMGMEIPAFVDSLQQFIVFQDYTFQGLLPDATEEGIWNLFEKLLDLESEPVASGTLMKSSNAPLSKKAATLVFDPGFVFNILSR